ncbi:AAA family ATPase [Acinetobacter sp. 1124_18A]|uniref:TniB family NTP-binding protein n=1 Tax=Acinetobacter sp. 1124_18A TaxID=2605958 RepID=UPI00405840CE
MNNIEKLLKFKNFISNYEEFSFALNGITECMNISIANNKPICSLLLGAGGVGKSTIGLVLKNRNKPYTELKNGFEKQCIPVFYLPVPSPITIKSLTIRMLEELGCNDQKGTSEQLNYRLRVLLKECETRLILLDEFHHIYSTTAKKNRTSENVANWIKTLADESKISICLIGLPDLQSNLFLDTQLARRFSHVFTLSPLSLNQKDKDTPSTLIIFLIQLEKFLSDQFKLTISPSLFSVELSKRIFLATSGYQAYVTELVYHSCLNALSENRITINLLDFDHAYSKKGILYKPLTKKNIFYLTNTEISNLM